MPRRLAPARLGLVRLLSLLLLLAQFWTAPDVAAEEVGDPDRGARAYGACRPCHDIGEGAINRTGPLLNGLLGAQAGQVEGYASSLPMVDAGLKGLVWSDETLEAYLSDPQGVVPDSTMPLIGVFDAQDRADLIAYLKLAGSPGYAEPARAKPVTR